MSSVQRLQIRKGEIQLSKIANVPSDTFDGSFVPYMPDGSVDTDKQWRADDDTLMHYNSNGKAAAVVFSISASCSEGFNNEIDAAIAAFNGGKGKDDSASRAEWVRIVIADRIGYDLSLEPERERGSGLAVYREKVAKATKVMDVLTALLASNPDLAATLKAQGVEL